MSGLLLENTPQGVMILKFAGQRYSIHFYDSVRSTSLFTEPRARGVVAHKFYAIGTSHSELLDDYVPTPSCTVFCRDALFISATASIPVFYSPETVARIQTDAGFAACLWSIYFCSDKAVVDEMTHGQFIGMVCNALAVFRRVGGQEENEEELEEGKVDGGQEEKKEVLEEGEVNE